MKFIIVVAILFCSLDGFSQPGDPNGGNPPGVPITGIEILVAGGAAYGIKKMIRKKRSS